MQSYSEVENYFVNKLKKFTTHQLSDVVKFIIKKMVVAIPDDFAEDELDEEMLLLNQLHQTLLKDELNKAKIKQLLDGLDEIVENYGDDYPADMNSLPISLIDMASSYCDIDDELSQDNANRHIVIKNAKSVIFSYLDFLDYQASEFDEIELDNWANYPIIKQGICALDDYLNQL